MPAAVNEINRSGHLMLPAAVIPFYAAGIGARHGESTINRDLPFVADANVRCGKRKVSVTVNSCVVVGSPSPDRVRRLAAIVPGAESRRRTYGIHLHYSFLRSCMSGFLQVLGPLFDLLSTQNLMCIKNTYIYDLKNVLANKILYN